MICVRGRLSVSSTTRRSIRENTAQDSQVRARVYIGKLCAHIYSVCIPQSVSAYSSLFPSTHAASLLPPASVSERDLRIGPEPQGSCLDWISNQCYTSCVLASAIFNTQGEAPPEGKGKLSACVGSSMGDIIIRMLGKKDSTQRRWMMA